MANAAAVKKEKSTVKAVGAMSAGVKIVDGQEMALDAASIRLVMEGWRLKRELEEREAQLKAINAQLIEAHGVGCALVAAGICRASIAEREAVKIKDAERLKAVLGFRFTDLVKTEIAYKPEARLVEMSADGDEPLAPSIRECLTVGKSQAVTWRAEK